MNSSFRFILVFAITTVLSRSTYSQEKEFEQMALTEKARVNFPIDYKILTPRLEYPLWDNDYDAFYSFLCIFNNKSVRNWI